MPDEFARLDLCRCRCLVWDDASKGSKNDWNLGYTLVSGNKTDLFLCVNDGFVYVGPEMRGAN